MISNITPPEMTPPVTYLRGEYALQNYKTPYYSAVLSMKFVVEKFSLIEEIQGEESIEWSIEELFQRDVSWDRIDSELVMYIRDKNRPQFFNALTVALLPVGDKGLADHYEKAEKYKDLDEDGLDESVQIGGVQLQSFSGSQGSAGKLRWDVNKVIAVAVDGQHRLAAMKEAEKHIGKNFAISSVPVIFLIPHKDTGYAGPSQHEQDISVISFLRSIFIDLNKNARPVSRTRNILLDDLDVPSVCIRTIIGDRLTERPSDDRLPLGAVDWMSEKNKFEDGPFVTTILTLYDLIMRILGSSGNFELTSEQPLAVRRWLTERFGIEEGEDVYESLMERVKMCYYDEVPLSFQPEEVNILRSRFEKRWSSSLVRLFRELTPYKEVIDYGIENRLHRPEFVNLYIAEVVTGGDRGEKKAEQIKSDIKLDDNTWIYDRNHALHLDKINNKFKKDNWAFKVVFQRALFYSYSDLWWQASEFVDDGLSGSKATKQYTDRWIEAINKLFSMGLGAVEARATSSEYFWAGIGLSGDGHIEFTKAATQRISSWLNAWVSMYWMESIPDYKELQDIQSDALVKICRGCLNSSGIINLVRGRSDPDIEDEALQAEVDEQIKLRYNKLKRERGR